MEMGHFVDQNKNIVISIDGLHYMSPHMLSSLRSDTTLTILVSGLTN